MGGVTGSVERKTRSVAGLVLLFDTGDRPDARAIGRALDGHPRATISFDPYQREKPHPALPPVEASAIEGDWLELLLDGLTFDLLGLSPGPPLAAPEVVHRYGIALGEDPVAQQGVGLFAGPHLAAAASALPVMRAMVAIGAHLAENLANVRAVCWTPARSAIAPAFFVRTAAAWLKGGPFPGMGLLGFAIAADGRLQSEGLDFFIGHELSLDPRLCSDPAEATRLAIRVAHELVGFELPCEPITFSDTEGGELLMAPDPAAGLIRVGPM